MHQTEKKKKKDLSWRSRTEPRVIKPRPVLIPRLGRNSTGLSKDILGENTRASLSVLETELLKSI